jgi:methionine-rich copper-binding protein CopC
MTFRCSLLSAALFCLTIPAWGHAILLKATPAVNQVVSGGSTRVEFRFNSRIDAKRSKLTLVGPDARERTLTIADQSSPDTLSSQATDLTPGSYIVRWQVLAQDGHITRGEVPFRVQ